METTTGLTTKEQTAIKTWALRVCEMCGEGYQKRGHATRHANKTGHDRWTVKR